MSNNLIPSTSAGGFSTVGNIAGHVFIGNGSQLTGITATANTGNILFDQSTIYSDQSNTYINFNAYDSGDIDVGTNNAKNVVIRTDAATGNNAWTFDAVGNLTLPGNTFAVKYANGTPVSISGGGGYGNTISNGTSNVTIPIVNGNVDINVGEAVSTFDDTGNLVLSNGFVIGAPGGVAQISAPNSLAIESNSNVSISANNYSWTFDNTGTLTVPYEGIIQSLNDTVILQSIDGIGNVYSARLGTNGGLYFATTEYPTGWLDITNDAGDANITSPINSGGAAGHNLNLTAGAADTAVYNANVGGNLNLVGGTGGFNDDGIGGPGGDVNITSGAPGEAGGLAGNVNITAGTAAWTFNNNSQLTVANLAISATNGIGAQATIFEDNGSLAVLASGTNGVVNVGWAENALTLGNTSVMWFNEPGNVGNAVIRTGNTAADSFAWIFDNAGNLTIPNSILAQNVSSPAPVISGFQFIGELRGNVSAGGVVITPSLSSIGNIAISTGNVANAAINFNVAGNAYGRLNISAVAIGALAGNVNQGVNSIAVGPGAAETAQGNASTALGWAAGQTNQGDLAIAVGSGAAYNSQGYAAIAIGADTSPISQGGYSIAIGAGASTGSFQANNSILIDATGTGTTPAAAAGFYVNPVRNDAANTGNVVTYNTTTKELAYTDTISVAGNVASGNVLTGGVVSATGNVRGANINTAGEVTATGNVYGGNIIAESMVYTAGVVSAIGGVNTPNVNITKSFVFTGNAGNANLDNSANFSTTGNVTGSYILGNAAYMTGQYSNSNVAAYLPTYTGELAGSAISVAGNIIGSSMYINGNATITGNATIQGNLTYNNLTNLTTANLVLGLGNNQTGSDVSGGGIAIGNTNEATMLYNYSANTWVSNINFSAVGNIDGGNVSGTLLTGTLATAAQPNITSVGTLSSLSVTGNINSGNVSGTLLTGTLATAAQPNVTSVGTLSSLDVSGNVTGGNLRTAGLVTATGNVTGGNVTTAGLVTATGNVTGGNVTTAGLVTATGNVTGGNIRTAGLVSATNISASGTIQGAGTISGASGSFNNIYSNGVLSATGNITGGNISVAGNLAGANLNVTTLNITSLVGTNISVTGTVNAAGNVSGGNFIAGAGGIVQATTIYGLTLVSSSGNIRAGLGISAVGNIQGASLLGTAVSISGGVTAAAATATGNITGGNILTAGSITATGNVTAGNFNSGGNLTIAGTSSLTGNIITSNITATGNITGGNISISGTIRGAGVISAAGNIVTGAFISASGAVYANASSTIAFVSGPGAASNVALLIQPPSTSTPANQAIRDLSQANSIIYFDVGMGAANTGHQFQFRGSNAFTNYATISNNGIAAKTPYINKTAWNVAADTEITVGNYRFRINNNAGTVYPQAISDISGTTINSAWTCVAAISGSAIAQAGSTGQFIANNAWTSLYTGGSMGSAGDTIVCTLQQKTAGRIYRITFIRSDNGTTTGYNIIAEQLL